MIPQLPIIFSKPISLFQDQVGEVLRKAGVSVVTTAVCNVSAFLAAALIPIPALRSFCFQAALLTLFNVLSMMLLFPAMIALDVRRVFAGKLDIMCCLAQDRNNGATSLKEVSNNDENEVKARKGCQYDNKQDPEAGERCYVSCSPGDCYTWTLTSFVTRHYSRWITLTPVKVLTIILAMILLGASAYGINKVEDGLELTDVVPRNTSACPRL